MTLKEKIKALAAECGYNACGIAGLEPFEDYRAALQDRIHRFPEAAELYRELEGRVDPRAVAPWAGSIVVCVRRYGKYAVPEELVGHIGRNYLCDRRIKACPDHSMPKKMKAGLVGMGARVKTGGVPGRAAAVRAGVAGFGRNNFVYAEGCGSWINIESWLIDAELEPDLPSPPAPCPDGCQACRKACPTGALQAPYVMRQDRCIAYLTFEAPEPVAPELWGKMGSWVYGCDVCQQVCPLNQGKWARQESTPWLDEVLDRLTPAALAGMDQDTYEKIVYPLFGYIPKDNLARWQANARRAVEAGSGQPHPGSPNPPA
jgi:epoxyqueuosine reductase